MVKFHYFIWIESDNIKMFDTIYNGERINSRTAQECMDKVINDNGIVEGIGLHIDCLESIEYFGRYKFEEHIPKGDGIYEIHCEVDRSGMEYPLVIEVKKVG